MPDMRQRAERWTASARDRTAQAGRQLMSTFAASDDDTDDAYFEAQLATIEQRMTTYGNWTRRAVNGAIITIGLRDAPLEAAARATVARLGHVEFDPGMTGCVMPDPVAYIERTKARPEARSRVSPGGRPRP